MIGGDNTGAETATGAGVADADAADRGDVERGEVERGDVLVAVGAGVTGAGVGAGGATGAGASAIGASGAGEAAAAAVADFLVVVARVLTRRRVVVAAGVAAEEASEGALFVSSSIASVDSIIIFLQYWVAYVEAVNLKCKWSNFTFRRCSGGKTARSSSYAVHTPIFVLEKYCTTQIATTPGVAMRAPTGSGSARVDCP